MFAALLESRRNDEIARERHEKKRAAESAVGSSSAEASVSSRAKRVSAPKRMANPFRYHLISTLKSQSASLTIPNIFPQHRPDAQDRP